MAATKKDAADAAAEPATKETKKATATKPSIRIIVRAFDHRIIDETCKQIVDSAENSGAIISGPVPLPTRIARFTVNRSTFKYKDAREQFEMRTHKRLIDINESTPNTLAALKTLTLPSGVDVEIKMV